MPQYLVNQLSSETFWTALFFLDLFVITFVAIYGYLAYYRRLRELKNIEIDSHKKSEEILKSTHLKTQEILEKVEHRADEILTHSELIKKDLNGLFENSIKQSGQKYLQMVEEHSKRFIGDYENLLTSVKNQSLEKTAKAMDLIEAEIRKSLEDSQGSVKTEIMKSLHKALEEIEAYKQHEIQKIDNEIDKLAIDIAKDVLRMNITPKDHKKLVMQALEKAKEQGMFFL